MAITNPLDQTLAEQNAPVVTAGVAKMSAIIKHWRKEQHVLFWVSMLLIAVCISLDAQTVTAYQPYALSQFQSHSLLSAVSTLQISLSAASQPVMAKVADSQGRPEALGLCLLLVVVGFVVNATSRSVEQISAGQILYGFGQTGLQFVQQLLSADTTTLANRSIFSSALYSPAIFTAWAGAPIVGALVPSHWRW